MNSTMGVAKESKTHDKRKSASRGPLEKLEEMDRAAILAFTAPGTMSRLGSTLVGMLPYHRQAWAAGTLFQWRITGTPDRSSAK